jgi:hypothetical protein
VPPRIGRQGDAHAVLVRTGLLGVERSTLAEQGICHGLSFAALAAHNILDPAATGVGPPFPAPGGTEAIRKLVGIGNAGS